MQNNGLSVTDEMEEAMEEHEQKGHTAVLIGINGKNKGSCGETVTSVIPS